MELELNLVTRFHLQLVTVEWLRKLMLFLEQDPRLEGSAVVTSDYNEDRFMGPESVVKYRFRIEFPDRPASSPLWSGYTAEVEYNPRRDDFKMRTVWWSVTWKGEPDMAAIPPLEGLPEPDVVRQLEESVARSWAMVPVAFEGPSVVVALADPEQLERASDLAWQLQRPARLRRVTPEELTHIVDAVHGPLELVDFLGLTAGEPLPGEPCERNLERADFVAGLGDRCLRLDWPEGTVSVEKLGERVSAFYQLRSWPGCRVRTVSPSEWAKLCELAEPDEAWLRVHEGEGERWSVRTTSAARLREAARWTEGSLRDEPFTRLCLGLMLAGFEVGVEKEAHWM